MRKLKNWKKKITYGHAIHPYIGFDCKIQTLKIYLNKNVAKKIMIEQKKKENVPPFRKVEIESNVVFFLQKFKL